MKFAEKLRNKIYEAENDPILQNLLKTLEKKALEGETEFVFISSHLSPSAINYLWHEGFIIQTFNNNHHLISW